MEFPPGVPDDFYQHNLLSKKSKIVYGETATSLTQFSYQALIFITRPTVTVQCGAAIISGNNQTLFCVENSYKSYFQKLDTWLISARHCVIEFVFDNSRIKFN